MKKISHIVVLILVCSYIIGQNIPYTYQYLFNPNLINPAITGSDERTCITFCDRHQWLGWSGSPAMQSLTATTRINKIGLGLTLYNDRNGATSNRGLKLTYAYHIKVGRFHSNNQHIAMAISFAGFQYVFDQGGLQGAVPGDQSITGGSESALSLDADIGVYYYDNSIRAGLSVMQLLSPNNFLGEDILSQYRFYRCYCIHGNYLIRTSPDFKLKPGLVFKLSEDFRKQLDLNLSGIYKKNYKLGISYRRNMDKGTGRSLSMLVYGGATFLERYTVFFGYDIGMSQIYRGSGGTYEFGFTVCFGNAFTIERRKTCPVYN